uniref:Uncharacterized protein n=1 Tax=Piliocolobus tephrosceles TaxID=591936 RepID=A0A8C9GQC1_9PRIM
MYGTIYLEKNNLSNDVCDNEMNELLKKASSEIELKNKTTRLLSSKQTPISNNQQQLYNPSVSAGSYIDCDFDYTQLQNEDKYLSIPFGEKNFLLRGCKLKNTDWIVGIVIYTGKETKIQMNSSKPTIKTSNLEMLTNKLTVIIWLLQMLVCCISAYYNAVIVSSSKKSKYIYLPFNLNQMKNPYIVGVIAFFSWIVITANFIPICLIVTMSFVKVILTYFIACDKNMIHKVAIYHTPHNEQVEMACIKMEESFCLDEVEKKKQTNNSSIKIEHNVTDIDCKKSVANSRRRLSTYKQTGSVKSIIEYRQTEDRHSRNVVSFDFSNINTNKSKKIFFKPFKEKNYIDFNAI